MKRLFSLILLVTVFSCNNGEEPPKYPEDPNYVPTHEDTLRYLDSIHHLHHDSVPPAPMDSNGVGLMNHSEIK